jgi:LPS O-antigen subunit length determinant protein (WzzB/FepE family)
VRNKSYAAEHSRVFQGAFFVVIPMSNEVLTMLQTFRSHLVGWFSKILIGLISIAFALFGIQYYLVGSRSNQSVVTVNGEKISPTQLTVAYNRNRNRLLNQYGSKL